MEWIKVTDALPEIPEGKHGIEVLICEYDPIYDEDESTPPKSRHKGLTVRSCHYGIVSADLETFPKE